MSPQSCVSSHGCHVTSHLHAIIDSQLSAAPGGRKLLEKIPQTSPGWTAPPLPVRVLYMQRLPCHVFFRHVAPWHRCGFRERLQLAHIAEHCYPPPQLAAHERLERFESFVGRCLSLIRPRRVRGTVASEPGEGCSPPWYDVSIRSLVHRGESVAAPGGLPRGSARLRTSWM